MAKIIALKTMAKNNQYYDEKCMDKCRQIMKMIT